MNIKLITSRNIHDYKSVLTELVDDFGYVFYHAILTWCGILDDGEPEKFWRVHLITSDDNVVGLCGLYSLRDNVDDLWLAWFGIIPEFRNNGIGAEALRLMKQEAYDVGCKRLMSYVDKEGKPLPFYYRNGFKLIGTVSEYVSRNTDISIDSFEDGEDFVIEHELDIVFLALESAVASRSAGRLDPPSLAEPFRLIDPKDLASLSEID